MESIWILPIVPARASREARIQPDWTEGIRILRIECDPAWPLSMRAAAHGRWRMERWGVKAYHVKLGKV